MQKKLNQKIIDFNLIEFIIGNLIYENLTISVIGSLYPNI